MKSVAPTVKEWTKFIKSKKINYVEFLFCDIYGLVKSFVIPSHALRPQNQGEGFRGKGFDGSSVRGFSSISESDLLCVPDLESGLVVPGKPDMLRFFCTIYDNSGLPFRDGDTRYCLKNLIHRKRYGEGKKEDLLFCARVEFEFFVFNEDNTDLDSYGYFDLNSIKLQHDFIDEIVSLAEQVGIEVSDTHHEISNSQFEIELAQTDLLAMADNIITLRYLIKQVIHRQKLKATFIPKPRPDRDGSALHIHLSISRGSSNLLFDPAATGGKLSKFGHSFVSGLKRYTNELILTTNQWINSYKRFQKGYDAPLFVECSRGIKETSIHIPTLTSTKSPLDNTIEITHPDSACNPYLAFAGIIAAGLQGEYEKKLPIYDSASWADCPDINKSALIEDLYHAAHRFKYSRLAVTTFGEKMHKKLVDLKLGECEDFQKHVSDWETKQYLYQL